MAPIDSEESGDASRSAWSEISRAMQEGTSWSGHERNRAWRNLGDGTFADVSTIFGLDQIDDGRVVIRTDWDRDGDVDLWLRSRSGSTLRYLENQTNPERVVELLGIDLATSASVGVVGEGGRTRTIHFPCQPASDGYLACSSRIGTAALAEDEKVVSVRYRSSDGRGGGGLGGSNLGQTFQLVPGEAIERLDDPVRVERGLGRGEMGASKLPHRVVLRTPHPIPAARAQALLNGNASQLVVVKSTECATCEAVVPAFLGRPGADGGIPTTVVTLEAQGDLRHGDFFLALAASVLGPGAELSLPVSALMDAGGNVQCLYLGALSGFEVDRDQGWYGAETVKAAFRTTIGKPGDGARWFHMAPRSFDRIIQELRGIGLSGDASIYAGAR